MIEAITEITNVGTFYSFKPDNPVRFSKLTLLYGPNGTGKTTLCAIFRSLARNDPAILQGRKTLGRQGTARVEIELSGGRKCIWDGSQWSGEAPPIEIYDEEFVRQNLYTDSVDVEHKRNLLRVVLGEEPTRLANEIARLDQQGRETQKEITRLENDLKAIVRHLMTLDEFLSLPEDPEIASKIDAKKAEVEAHRDAEAIKKLDKLERLRVPEPPADLEALCARTIDDVAADAEQRLREHLKRCRIEDESWLQKGLGFVHDETCPFCGQSLAGVRELIAAYRAVFSDAYRNLKAGVEQARKTVEHSFGEAAAGKIAECLAENRRRADLWQKYGVQDLDAWEISCDWRTAFKEFHDAALELLNRKAGALLEAVPSDRLRPAREKLDAALTALRCYNKTVESLNERIANLQGRVSTDRLDAARQQLQRLELVSKRYEHEIQKNCNDLKALRQQRFEIDKEKNLARKQLEETSKSVMHACKDRVNRLLERFGAGFAIRDVVQEHTGGKPALGWELEIRGQAVPLGKKDTPASQPSFKNTLSAGDRSALGFAFFISQLEQKADLAERVVVLDDPFTSQDSFRRNETANCIRELGKRVCGAVVCSHDAEFARLVYERWGKQNKATWELQGPYKDGTVIKESDIALVARSLAIADLEDLRKFAEEGQGEPPEIVRKIRPVLESYLKRRFASKVKENASLGEIVNDNEIAQCLQQEEIEQLKKINEYVRPYHHGGPQAEVAMHSIDRRELETYVKWVLKFVG